MRESRGGRKDIQTMQGLQEGRWNDLHIAGRALRYTGHRKPAKGATGARALADIGLLIGKNTEGQVGAK